jgi:hypothetical protein
MCAAFSASTTRTTNAFILILKIIFIAIILLFIPGDSRVILNPMELKMKPTIHLECKAGYDAVNIQLYLPNVLWVAFSISLESLLLVNHLVYLSKHY